MTQSYQHWAANLLAERASLLPLRPQNVIRWVRRVWGGNETPTTTITKYNPEDLRLSKCLWQLAVAKVKAFICSEFSHYRVVKTGNVSEFDDCEKLAIEDGKHTLLQHQYVILRGNSSQSSARSFSNLPQSTRICQLTHRVSEISAKDDVSNYSTNHVFTHTQNRNLQKVFSWWWIVLRGSSSRSPPPIPSVQ